MEKRFQAKKLNKDDHKNINKTAKVIKRGLGGLSICIAVAPLIKKCNKYFFKK